MAARPEKVAVVDEVKQSLDGAVATILTDYRGLSVGELAELRAELRKTNATYRVAKNTLMRRAADEAQIGIAELMTGPTALVFCEDDPVGPAKALKAFARNHPELIVKGGWLDGELLDADAAIKLADLESREELLAKLAGLMYGALANTARLLNAAPSKLAQLMAALEADGGAQAKGFSPSAPAQAPAAMGEASDEPEAVEAGAPEDAETSDEPVAEVSDEPVAEAPDEPEAVEAGAPEDAETSDEPEAVEAGAPQDAETSEAPDTSDEPVAQAPDEPDTSDEPVAEAPEDAEVTTDTDDQTEQA